MSEDIIKLLLSVGEVTLMAITIMLLVYFLAPGRGKQNAAEAETSKKREENEGKLIDVTTSMASTMSELKDSYAKLVEVETATVEWHKTHDTKLEALSLDVKTRSKLDGEAIEEFRTDVDSKYAATEANINSIKTDIATHMASINEQLNGIRDTLQQRNDCADVVDKVDNIKKAVERLEQAEAARAVADKKMITDTLPAVDVAEKPAA